MILTLHAVSLAAAFALDAVIGDPAAIPHPVDKSLTYSKNYKEEP